MNTETKNFEHEKKILDSGARREFASGAVRDIQEGKGRCDLLPLEEIGLYLVDRLSDNNGIFLILSRIDRFIHCGDVRNIYSAISQFLEERNWKVITALLEVSKHYEEGAKKYEERNWEKGIPAHCYVDSAVRHLFKWYDKWDDEPHDRAFLWNMFCLLWTVGNKPELNDLPYAQAQKQDCVKLQDDFTPDERISLLKAIRESCDEAKKMMKGETENGK